MNLSFLEVFTLFAIIHCLLLSLVILFSRFLRSAVNRYLGYSLLIISIVGINNWFWDVGKHPTLIQILDLPLWQFLYPATLLIYFIKAAGFELKKSQWFLLFTPFAVLSFLNIIVSLDSVFNAISLPFSDKDLIIFYFYKSISFLTIAFFIFFGIISFKYVFLKRKGNSLEWLKINWFFLAFLIAFGAVLESQRLLYSQKEPLAYLWVLISLFIYWLIYSGVYRFRLSNEQYEIRQLIKNARANSHSSNKQEDQNTPHLLRLEVLLKEENIYLNPQLSRDEVAEQLGISGGYLSQLLNTRANRSFTDYINAFRVEEVKKMIKNPDFDKYSLLSIGLEAGFNSKSVFYSSFKKETGMTPNEYKKNNKS